MSEAESRETSRLVRVYFGETADVGNPFYRRAVDVVTREQIRVYVGSGISPHLWVVDPRSLVKAVAQALEEAAAEEH